MSERLETKQIIDALRCSSTEGNVCRRDCPYYVVETVPPELAAKIGESEWDKCDCDRIGMDAAARLEELEAENARMRAEKPKWISAEEQLPEADVPVLVYAVGDYPGFEGTAVIAITSMEEVRLLQRKTWRSPWQYFLTDYKITHWMALPGAPEEVHDEE